MQLQLQECLLHHLLWEILQVTLLEKNSAVAHPWSSEIQRTFNHKCRKPMAVLQTNCISLRPFQKIATCQLAPANPRPVFGPSVHQCFPELKQCLRNCIFSCNSRKFQMLVTSQKSRSKGLAVAPIGLRYHAKENGALPLFSSRNGPQVKSLCMWFMPSKMKLNCTDIFLICACHPEYE